MTNDPTVLVLAGGLSHERDVSIRSGRRVADALRGTGCHVEVADLDASLLDRLEKDAPDVVWPLLHGATGEDGSVRDVLDLVGLPYVGSPAAACRLTWDKPVASTLVAGVGVHAPERVALPHVVFRELGSGGILAALERRIGLPLVVKPARGGSALGVTVVTAPDQLPEAMVDCFAYCDVALVERAVIGREVAVSVIDTGDGPYALPAVEIDTHGGPYDYDARYNPGRAEYFAPARLTPDEETAVLTAAVDVFRTLGHRHLVRVDFIIDDAGVPWFLEANVAPGMTEVSLLPQAVEASRQDLGALYRRIVDHALDATGTPAGTGTPATADATGS